MGFKKFISKKARQAIYKRDNMICCYCGKQCIAYTEEAWANTPKEVATLDHITSQWAIAQTCESDAEFRKAIADPKNLVVVCNGCNSHKREIELYIWCAMVGFEYGKIIEEIGRRVQRAIA